MNGESLSRVSEGNHDLQQFYHVTVILDFEYTAESEEHARTLAANHISTSLRLGTTTSRRIRIKPLGANPSGDMEPCPEYPKGD